MRPRLGSLFTAALLAACMACPARRAPAGQDRAWVGPTPAVAGRTLWTGYLPTLTGPGQGPTILRQASALRLYLLVLPSDPAPGRPSRPEAACRTFVQKFYTWYVHTALRGGFGAAIERRPGLFSGELLRRLREDRAAQRESPGELVGLEFDPFLNAQDVAKRYEVGPVSRKGERYLAPVYAIYGSGRPARPALVAELRTARERWVFANFRYSKEGDQTHAEDLLGILARLRAQRARSGNARRS